MSNDESDFRNFIERVGTPLDVLGEAYFCQCPNPEVNVIVERVSDGRSILGIVMVQHCNLCDKDLWDPPGSSNLE